MKIPSVSVALSIIMLFVFHSEQKVMSRSYQSNTLVAQCQNIEIRPSRGSRIFRRNAQWETCAYRLVFQGDGNLVLYRKTGGVLWATGTERLGADMLAIQDDGNIVLYAGHKPVWATDTDRNPGAFFAIQNDGNLVVYNRSGRSLWTSNTDRGQSRTRAAAAEWSQKHLPKQVSQTTTGDISLPFNRGEIWYICQGYQGTVTHQNYYALDLAAGPDFGTSACWGNQNRAAGKTVLAPASGVIYHIGSDLACLSIYNSRSLLLGHFSRNIGHGQRVSKGQILGILNQAAYANGYFAHIHLEGRQSNNCNPGTSVPLTHQFGFQLEGIGDLPDLPTRNDYFKRILRR